MTESQATGGLDAREIVKVLPHRYPFLLVDRILELVPNQRVVGLKNVTANEPQFTGHFPDRPIMPGVLIVEALAQVGAVLMLEMPANKGKLGILAGIDGCRFRRMVVPGDQLIMTVELLKLKGSFSKVKATATVDGELAAEAELLFYDYDLTEFAMTLLQVHQTAVIHPTATLAADVQIGPYAIIGERAFVDAGTRIGPHAIVDAFTSIGRDCEIHAGAVVGGVPQDRKFGGAESYCVVGDRNIIREHVTINRATAAGEATRIGHDNLFMAYVHVAHDCQIGNDNVFANGVTLAGHVLVEDHVTLGGMTGLHQFIRVGSLAMVGAMSRLSQDVPPYMLVEGGPPKVYGPNVVGLRRQGIDPAGRAAIKRAYKLMYRARLNLGQAIAEMGKLDPTFEIQHLISFLQGTERGISGIARIDAGLEAES